MDSSNHVHESQYTITPSVTQRPIHDEREEWKIKTCQRPRGTDGRKDWCCMDRIGIDEVGGSALERGQRTYSEDGCR